MSDRLRSSISVQEISKHCSPSDAWIVVDDHVYDVTEFAPQHPGGAALVLNHAGRDATETYNQFHSPSTIRDNISPEKHLGLLDESTVSPDWAKPPPSQTKENAAIDGKPPLGTLISTSDFEAVAQKTISRKAWAFYSSAATDLITRDANRSLYNRIWFRPRVLKRVRDVDTRCRTLGLDSSMPLIISPAAMAKMIHPEGEKALAGGAARKNIIQCISSSASFTAEEITRAAPASQPSFFQLYVNNDRSKTEALLRRLNALGNIKAIFLTVDAAAAGKREADERVTADTSTTLPMSGMTSRNDKRGGGLGRLMGTFIDANLNWDDIAWLRTCTGIPIVIKGIQCAADAQLAMRYGVDGIVLSNHGGRNLDTSPPAILVLLELQRCCPEVFDAMEVHVDGGIRRGTDILKALCLGAKAVGVGRPFLYALNYGQEGVEHLFDILRDELEVAMRLVGITDLSQVHPGLVNTLDVDHLVPTSLGHPYARWRPKSNL